MKSLIFSLLAMIATVHLQAQQATIASPELTVLYLGYPNKIVPTVPNGETCIVSIDNGTITPSQFSIDGIHYNGYIVKPNRVGRFYITVSGKNKNGKIKNYGSFTYMVKMLPNPNLYEYSVSKSMGGNISIGLGDSPLAIAYTVKGGTITIGEESYKFEGSRISSSLLEKAEVDKNIVIEVIYQRNGSEELQMLSSVMKVTP
jgi:hypothetical protein